MYFLSPMTMRAHQPFKTQNQHRRFSTRPHSISQDSTCSQRRSEEAVAGHVGKGGNSTIKQPAVLPHCPNYEKDGSSRFCVDYRKVNTVTRKDAYPRPHLDDTLDSLAGSKLF